jgi:SAM-dependent methyltransferase
LAEITRARTGPYALAPPAAAVPLSRGRLAAVCLREIADELPLLGRRRRRTATRSQLEYEQRWAGQAAGARWLAAERVEDAVGLSSFGDATLTALMEFRPYAVPAPDFFRWRARKLALVVGTHHPPSTPIAEIGCGLGKNLLALASAGFERLSGFDPTASAVEAVAAQAAHFGLDIETGRLDLLDPDPGVTRSLAGRVLLTNHVMEQLPRGIPTALDTLLGCQPAEVLHLEPCAELLRPWRWAPDLATAVHMRAVDYQRTLLTELRRLERAGRITILEVRPLGYAPRVRHAPALVRWTPR